MTKLDKHEDPKQTIFHGTFWAIPGDGDIPEDSVFYDLDPGFSDLNVVFVTNAEKTAEYFSGWHKNTARDIQVILKGTLSTDRLYEKTCDELMKNRCIEIDDVEYDISDREDTFDALRPTYDGFAIRGNYDGVGDDIALFDGNLFDAKEAKLLIDNEWTDWLDLVAAREAFYSVCAQFERSAGPKFG